MDSSTSTIPSEMPAGTVEHEQPVEHYQNSQLPDIAGKSFVNPEAKYTSSSSHQTKSESGSPPEKADMIANSAYSRHRLQRRQTLWKIENLRVLILCSLVGLPMIAFTVITISLVFGYKVSATACPNPGLCPNDETINGTDAENYYYVDFPAAGLAFIASWSSTVSFTLVGALMAIYSYAAAHQFLRLSCCNRPDISYPTPYQMSMLIRVLNAEILALYDIIWTHLKEAFWDRKHHRTARKTPRLLQGSIVVFVIGVLARQVQSQFLPSPVENHVETLC